MAWGNHPRHRTSPSNWAQPLAWNRKAARDGARGFVFCASLADVFDNQVAPEWRRDLFDLIRQTPHMTWLLLTKRPQNIEKLFLETVRMSAGEWGPGLAPAWPRNAAIGCTVVTQDEADRDIPHLLRAKAALKPAFAFVSMEPLLGPVDIRPWLAGDDGCESCDDGVEGAPNRCSRRDIPRDEQCPRTFEIFDYAEGPPDNEGVPAWITEHRLALDWVISGGETDQGKHKARPSHPDWFRSLRDQCAAAGVPFHFKQWGEWREAENGDRFDTSKGNNGKPSAFIVDPDDGTVHCFLPDKPNPRYRVMIRVGKKAAGRLLDGVDHNATPAP